MATIIGGIGTSHVPTIGLAYDRGKQNDPDWAPLFRGYERVVAWLADNQPDVLVYFYNDHVSSFFFDVYPTFNIGANPLFAWADEGAGPRKLPPMRGHPELAAHIAQSLVNDEFDMSVFQDRPLDHGCNSPLSLMWPHEPDWPGAIVPIAINVLQQPTPTPARCFKLGQAVRRAVRSFPQDLRVAIVGTGGLSHQVHGERTGFNNTEWDMKFLELIEHDPAQLAKLRTADFIRLGGAEGAEVIMWLAMRGALAPKVRKVHHNYYLPFTTAMAVAVFENVENGDEPAVEPVHGNPQLAGIEALEGTYPFDILTSVRTLRVNRFLWKITQPEHRALLTSDAERAFEEAGLSEEERDLIRRRDWKGMIHYGVNFFVMEKMARIDGIPNAVIYAGMRGESLDDFLKTRNVPGAR
jgi:gallate dioxygenase